MFDFCPHCGQTIDGQQVTGQTLVCRYCRQLIGTVAAPPVQVVVDKTEALLRRGLAVRCPHCQQAVELKTTAAGKAMVPHFGAGAQRNMCPGSGKPATLSPSPPAVAAPPTPMQRPRTSKDLSAFMTREFIRVVSCQRDGEPRIEELRLEYLDKTDRVRLQIDALRDILGTDFRLQVYPAQLHRPHLAVWGNATVCVVANKHPQGGYQPMTDEEICLVVEDLRQHKALFLSGASGERSC